MSKWNADLIPGSFANEAERIECRNAFLGRYWMLNGTARIYEERARVLGMKLEGAAFRGGSDAHMDKLEEEIIALTKAVSAVKLEADKVGWYLRDIEARPIVLPAAAAAVSKEDPCAKP